MQSHTFTIPLVVEISKKTKFYINLNQYRNAHFHILNKAKVEFDRMVRPLLIGVPQLDSTHLTYTLYSGSMRAADVSNICSIADKFFSDTLVGAGILPDDNFHHISDVRYVYGGYDKGNSRLEVTLHNCVPKTKVEPMRIILTANEVQAALLASLAGILNDDLKTQVFLRETEEGVIAEIEVTQGEVEPTEPTEKPATKPRGRRAASKVVEVTEAGTPEIVIPHVPNAETEEALQAANDGDTETVSNVDALFADLDNVATEEEPFAVTPAQTEDAPEDEAAPTPVRGLFANLQSRKEIRDHNAEV